MNLAILTPAADQDLYIRLWSDWYAQLEAALAGVGLKASPHSWTEPLPGSFDAVLPMIAISGRSRPVSMMVSPTMMPVRLWS
jgi:hypothetical protein